MNFQWSYLLQQVYNFLNPKSTNCWWKLGKIISKSAWAYMKVNVCTEMWDVLYSGSTENSTNQKLYFSWVLQWFFSVGCKLLDPWNIYQNITNIHLVSKWLALDMWYILWKIQRILTLLYLFLHWVKGDICFCFVLFCFVLFCFVFKCRILDIALSQNWNHRYCWFYQEWKNIEVINHKKTSALSHTEGKMTT